MMLALRAGRAEDGAVASAGVDRRRRRGPPNSVPRAGEQRTGDKVLFVLPGPPDEFAPLEEHILPAEEAVRGRGSGGGEDIPDVRHCGGRGGAPV